MFYSLSLSARRCLRLLVKLSVLVFLLVYLLPRLIGLLLGATNPGHRNGPLIDPPLRVQLAWGEEYGENEKNRFSPGYYQENAGFMLN